jgi:hypothetical protein
VRGMYTSGYGGSDNRCWSLVFGSLLSVFSPSSDSVPVSPPALLPPRPPPSLPPSLPPSALSLRREACEDVDAGGCQFGQGAGYHDLIHPQI